MPPESPPASGTPGGLAETRAILAAAGASGVHPERREVEATVGHSHDPRQARPVGDGQILRRSSKATSCRSPMATGQVGTRIGVTGIGCLPVQVPDDDRDHADIKGFFDSVDHANLMICLQQRVADRKFLRLIERLLKAGVLEEGVYQDTEQGTPQGGILSPILITSSCITCLIDGASSGRPLDWRAMPRSFGMRMTLSSAPRTRTKRAGSCRRFATASRAVD